MIPKILINVSLLFLLISCKRETITPRDLTQECLDSSFIGRTSIEDSSRVYLKYELNDRVTFENRDGEVLSLKCTLEDEGSSPSGKRGFCEFDPRIEVDFMWEEEYKTVVLENDSLVFYISLFADLNSNTLRDISDILRIEIETKPIPGMFIGFWLNISENQLRPNLRAATTFFESIRIHGVELTNVFRQMVDTTDGEHYEIWYNKEKGLVAFEDANVEVWVLK